MQQIASQSINEAENYIHILNNRIKEWNPTDITNEFKSDFIAHALAINKEKIISKEEIDLFVYDLKQKANYVSWILYDTTKLSYECKNTVFKTLLISIYEKKSEEVYEKMSIEGLYKNKKTNTFIWLNKYEDNMFKMKAFGKLNHMLDRPMRKIETGAGVMIGIGNVQYYYQ